MANIVRAFVIALTLAGAASSVRSSNAFAGPVAKPRPSSLPVPMCPPSDPNACGMGKNAPN